MSSRELPKMPEVPELLDGIDDVIKNGQYAKYLPADMKQPCDSESVGRFFFYILFNDSTFETSSLFKLFVSSLPNEALRCKRTAALYCTLDRFLKKYRISAYYTIDKEAASEVIKGYLTDLNIFKIRYDSDVVQLPKIAGLMTSLIMRYRPVVPVNRGSNPIPKINEVFATYHGLCLCSDFSNGDELSEFSKTEDCKVFFDDMTYLLDRIFTAECLIMVFKVLCLSHFPKFKGKNIYG